MNLFKRTQRGALWVIGLMLAASSHPAQADIIFTITDPAYGVLVGNGSVKAFTSATNNPASADVNGAHASMTVSGAQVIFSANIVGIAGERFMATTGAESSPNDGRIGPVGVQIVGTAGETRNTPLSITLNSVYTGPGTNLITQIVNGDDYPLNASSVISGLHVGDTFEFWAGVYSNDAGSAALTSTLTVSAAPGALVPEPGSLALMGSLGVAGIGLLRRKSRR